MAALYNVRIRVVLTRRACARSQYDVILRFFLPVRGLHLKLTAARRSFWEANAAAIINNLFTSCPHVIQKSAFAPSLLGIR